MMLWLLCRASAILRATDFPASAHVVSADKRMIAMAPTTGFCGSCYVLPEPWLRFRF